MGGNNSSECEADFSWSLWGVHVFNSENTLQTWNPFFLFTSASTVNTTDCRSTVILVNWTAELSVITHRLFSLVGLSGGLDPFSQFIREKKHKSSFVFSFSLNQSLDTLLMQAKRIQRAEHIFWSFISKMHPNQTCNVRETDTSRQESLILPK